MLLENEQETLPVDFNSYTHIVLMGEREEHEALVNWQTATTTFQDFDNIGAQNGGWSVSWQGYNGNFFWSGEHKDRSHASSILDALKARVDSSKTQLLYPTYSNPSDQDAVAQERNSFLSKLAALNGEADKRVLVIGVLAENPYSEWMGEINNPFCWGTSSYAEGCIYNVHANMYMPDQQATEIKVQYSDFAAQVISKIKEVDSSAKMVHVVLSGRPVMMDMKGANVDALIAAFLPGTAGGEAIVTALNGEYNFRQEGNANRLPVEWFNSMDSLKDYPIYKAHVKGRPEIPDAKYPIGHGLATGRKHAQA